MSDLISKLNAAIREHALPSCPTYQMMIDCAGEIKTLRQRVIDCGSCIERREQINTQMQVENERLQARITSYRYSVEIAELLIEGLLEYAECNDPGSPYIGKAKAFLGQGGDA